MLRTLSAVLAVAVLLAGSSSHTDREDGWGDVKVCELFRLC